MSQVETNEVSAARSDQFEEYGTMLDAQRRLDGMQLEEEEDGSESLVEMTALNDETGAKLSISMVSTGYDASFTVDDISSCDDLTDDLMSIYSDHDESELEVECPTFFSVSRNGHAVAMDSIEALDKLADFVPIPVDITAISFDPLVANVGKEKTSLQSVAEYTAHAGDTDSCTTCPHDNHFKDAAITEPRETTDKADITSYPLNSSETDVTVIDENDYSVYSIASSERIVEMSVIEVAKSPTAADITVYSVEKSEREVEMSEGSLVVQSS
ncbi:hypothetical protein PENTCL1PPCAC_18175 [Pristionchus entomophagus]|uniref:Uncharacterized protein n=1 Tax=Pristionchus entomophagus TaxID=358040 RepID=A0AAV5TP22_9BILA|nr:hypothetical protein PENTCL1PPCAC_18175 [Pristionchus entomophagus]